MTILPILSKKVKYSLSIGFALLLLCILIFHFMFTKWTYQYISRTDGKSLICIDTLEFGKVSMINTPDYLYNSDNKKEEIIDVSIFFKDIKQKVHIDSIFINLTDEDSDSKLMLTKVEMYNSKTFESLIKKEFKSFDLKDRTLDSNIEKEYYFYFRPLDFSPKNINLDINVYATSLYKKINIHNNLGLVKVKYQFINEPLMH